jgi:hypothetical protein
MEGAIRKKMNPTIAISEKIAMHAIALLRDPLIVFVPNVKALSCLGWERAWTEDTRVKLAPQDQNWAAPGVERSNWLGVVGSATCAPKTGGLMTGSAV